MEEATFLSDRVLVMEAGPGRITDDVEVPFGPERDGELKLTPEFLEVRACLQQTLWNRTDATAAPGH